MVLRLRKTVWRDWGTFALAPDVGLWRTCTSQKNDLDVFSRCWIWNGAAPSGVHLGVLNFPSLLDGAMLYLWCCPQLPDTLSPQCMLSKMFTPLCNVWWVFTEPFSYMNDEDKFAWTLEFIHCTYIVLNLILFWKQYCKVNTVIFVLIMRKLRVEISFCTLGMYMRCHCLDRFSAVTASVLKMKLWNGNQMVS